MNQNANIPPAVQAQLTAMGHAPPDAARPDKSPDPLQGSDAAGETGARRQKPDGGRKKGAFARGADQPSLADIVEACVILDHSDTDNAKRLLTHFGADLLVVTQSKAKSPFYAVWTGASWDTDNGGPRALALAQQLGDLIMMEVEHIGPTPDEAEAMGTAETAWGEMWPALSPDDVGPKQSAMLRAAHAALKAWQKRRASRASFAVGSKNLAKMNAMLACAAPHIMRDPDDFNADRYSFATLNHTIRFGRETVIVPAQSDAQEDGEAIRATVDVRKGHAREDLITQLVPVDFDPDATCPKWEAFLTRMLPDPLVRKLVQIAFALGLVGVTVQKLFFHYGSGANGKSVAMEVICRLLGSASVTLPATSFIGESNTGGSASPDIARLYGRRFLRVKELPVGEDLKENLVKEVTGGEAITARDLHQGYFDFDPLFTPHMSGNGYPRITGMDNGIWRRMCVIHWPVQLSADQQRDFEDVMGEFEAEFPGILNWLVDGMRMFLEEGLVIPEAVARATQDYRDEMDPTAAFCAACVRPDAGGKLTAKDFYHAYVNYTVDQGGKPIALTRFGLIMKRKYERQEGRTNHYLGVVLVNVPRGEGDSGPGGAGSPPGHWEEIPPI
ncbi:phage/plasmid primase, P4 family [Hoeflea sp.]|uniref:phage/plasmid primase, P4 family n=1 Tax=Hoeflea sp. TaxID=1940281 RepID=UPI0019897F9C|nr:phage/plasmid primase, P4 family [Hoeflea sp.]MBC7280021.1 DNA primase [Hoeflea sp.]